MTAFIRQVRPVWMQLQQLELPVPPHALRNALLALGVGLLESFGSFWASAYKEVIVFGSILPVLLWRSLRDPHSEEH